MGRKLLIPDILRVSLVRNMLKVKNFLAKTGGEGAPSYQTVNNCAVSNAKFRISYAFARTPLQMFP